MNKRKRVANLKHRARRKKVEAKMRAAGLIQRPTVQRAARPAKQPVPAAAATATAEAPRPAPAPRPPARRRTAPPPQKPAAQPSRPPVQPQATKPAAPAAATEAPAAPKRLARKAPQPEPAPEKSS
ncbi:MAG: hypothetical protein Q8O40_10640 [Chloroflexota bacterium]|nr:hypothetical protein [Chloroflexota bacterium]